MAKSQNPWALQVLEMSLSRGKDKSVGNGRNHNLCDGGRATKIITKEKRRGPSICLFCTFLFNKQKKERSHIHLFLHDKPLSLLHLQKTFICLNPMVYKYTSHHFFLEYLQILWLWWCLDQNLPTSQIVFYIRKYDQEIRFARQVLYNIVS